MLGKEVRLHLVQHFFEVQVKYTLMKSAFSRCKNLILFTLYVNALEYDFSFQTVDTHEKSPFTVS